MYLIYIFKRSTTTLHERRGSSQMNCVADASQPIGKMIVAKTASAGLAQGRALLCECGCRVATPRRHIEVNEAPQEMARFDSAVETVERELAQLQDTVRTSIGNSEAEIFGAQILMLREVELRNAVLNHCTEERMNVEAAVEQAIERLRAVFAQMQDPYLQERGADLLEVGKRLLDCLANVAPSTVPSDAEGCVLVTREASTSVVAQLKGRGVQGLILEQGGLTTHAAIIARALGIPMLVQAVAATKEIAPGARVILDAIAGRAFINPDSHISHRYSQLEKDLRAHAGILEDQIDLPAITLDGAEITLAANIGQAADAVAAGRVKASGAGLYRTEFIFQVQDHFPDEEEQYRFYRDTAERLAPNKTVIRLLDVGSDKPLSYFPMPREENPALGRRGVRLLLEHPSILHTQLRAILRSSAIAPVSILLPMVGGVDELRAINEEIDGLKIELDAAQIPYAHDIPVGVMIETPAAALLAEELTAEASFLSVGTNDLVQYVLCADRTGDSNAYDPLHPAVLRILASLARTAQSAGKPISLCGEIASDPLYTALLLGLGFRHFSVTPERLLETKYAIRSIHLFKARELARKVLSLGTVHEIRAQIEEDWAARRPVVPLEIALPAERKP